MRIEAGPFQTIPYAGSSWQTQTKARPLDHEYLRNGTAKLMTLFHSPTGEVRVRGTRSCTNEVLHGWMKEELAAVVGGLPAPADALGMLPPKENRKEWTRWQEGLTRRITLPKVLP